MAYDGLLLDHDGVICTLADIETRQSVFREQLRRELDGTIDVGDTLEEVAETLAARADLADVRSMAARLDLDPATLWRHRDDSINRGLRTAIQRGEKAPYDDVEYLDAVRRPLGIASNNQTRVIEFALDHYGLGDRFDAVRARSPDIDALQYKKPAPTLLERAMSDMDVSNPLYVGDSESDILAAERAGLDVALVRRDHNATRAFEATPTYDVTGLETVLELLE